MKTQYIADDGTVFENAEDCQQHELFVSTTLAAINGYADSLSLPDGAARTRLVNALAAWEQQRENWIDAVKAAAEIGEAA